MQAFTAAAQTGPRLLNKAFTMQDSVLTMVSQLDRTLVDKCTAIAARRRAAGPAVPPLVPPSVTASSAPVAAAAAAAAAVAIATIPSSAPLASPARGRSLVTSSSLMDLPCGAGTPSHGRAPAHVSPSARHLQVPAAAAAAAPALASTSNANLTALTTSATIPADEDMEIVDAPTASDTMAVLAPATEVAATPRAVLAPAPRLAQLSEQWVATTAGWSVDQLERALVAIVRRVARHASDWDKTALLDALNSEL